jgi:predicted nucleotidyltransferase
MQYRAAVQALKSRLSERYGQALERVIVFGSVARHTACAASDMDIMVVLTLPQHSVDWSTIQEIRALALAVELEYDVVFDLTVIDMHELAGLRGHTPFMERVLAEGVDV